MSQSSDELVEGADLDEAAPDTCDGCNKPILTSDRLDLVRGSKYNEGSFCPQCMTKVKAVLQHLDKIFVAIDPELLVENTDGVFRALRKVVERKLYKGGPNSDEPKAQIIMISVGGKPNEVYVSPGNGLTYRLSDVTEDIFPL